MIVGDFNTSLLTKNRSSDRRSMTIQAKHCTPNDYTSYSEQHYRPNGPKRHIQNIISKQQQNIHSSQTHIFLGQIIC